VEVSAALAAAAAVAAAPVEVFNHKRLIGCVQWQKYRINHKTFLFL